MKSFSLCSTSREKQLLFVLLANFDHDTLLENLGSSTTLLFLAFAYKSHPRSKELWKEDLGKASLQSKNDQEKKIRVDSVFILVLLHILVRGHKSYCSCLLSVSCCALRQLSTEREKYCSVCYRFVVFQKRKKKKKGRKNRGGAQALSRKKKEKKFGRVWFCPLYGRLRLGSKTWEKFCLVYCYFVVSCLATVCNHGVEEIVWFDLLLVLLSTPFGFFIGILHFGEDDIQATSGTHSLYFVCSELRS